MGIVRTGAGNVADTLGSIGTACRDRGVGRASVDAAAGLKSSGLLANRCITGFPGAADEATICGGAIGGATGSAAALGAAGGVAAEATERERAFLRRQQT